MTDATRPPAGVPPGLIEAILGVLARSPTPVRRRALLEELERTGHRVSLAGLNRALQYCRESGRTVESAEGVRPGVPGRP